MRLSARTVSCFRFYRAPSRRGYALLLILMLVAVTGVLASVLVPDLVRQSMRIHAKEEEGTLALIGKGLRLSILRTQTVPGKTNWVDAVVRETELNRLEVTQVYPHFPSDTNTQRIYLIHPSWTPSSGSGLLPYHQSPEGVGFSTTQAPTIHTRLMVVSNTRRELALPMASGVASATQFDQLWEWAYDPVLKSPPAGWPSSWSGKADGLHLERLDLADYFHTLTLKNLNYSLDKSYPFENVTTEVRRHMLRGSLLEVFRHSGVLYASFIVNKDRSFDLTPKAIRALLYFGLNETTGTLGVNGGRAGAGANLTYINNPILGGSGPSALPASNRAVKFNGNGDRAESGFKLPASLAQFTLAVWIHPTGNMGTDEGIVGERDVVYFKTKDQDEITLVTFASGSVTFDYNVPHNTWHHLAAVADGQAIKIYLDGSLVTTRVQAVANYGNPSSTPPFRVAGQIVSSADYFKGTLDEVVFYDEALTASEIMQLFAGTVL